METARVSKFAVAEEQLITAINLYFSGTQPVSVHTLVRAAHEVLDEICAHRGLERGVVQQGSKWIKPEMRDRFWKKINEARNFFKHAKSDPDPEGSIEWNPELSMHYIWDAVALYRRITGDKMPCELLCFSLWYRLNNPELWVGTPTEFDGIISQADDVLKDLNKQDAYTLLMEACRSGVHTNQVRTF